MGDLFETKKPKPPKVPAPPPPPEEFAREVKRNPALGFELLQNQLSTSAKLGGLGFGSTTPPAT